MQWQSSGVDMATEAQKKALFGKYDWEKMKAKKERRAKYKPKRYKQEVTKEDMQRIMSLCKKKSL